MICVLALIAPNEEARGRSAQVVGEDRMLVVHLDAPPEVCAARNQTDEAGDGVETSLDFQKPDSPDLVLDSDAMDTSECVDQIIKLLESKNLID